MKKTILLAVFLGITALAALFADGGYPGLRTPWELRANAVCNDNAFCF